MAEGLTRRRTRYEMTSSQPLTRGRIEVMRQATAFVANRNQNCLFIRLSLRLYPDRATGTIRISILACIRNEFSNDQAHENRTIRCKLNCSGCFKLNVVGSDRGFQVADNLAQILNQIDLLVVGGISETLIGTPNGIHATRCFVESFTDVHGSTNAVLGKQFRCSEALLIFAVVGNNRLAGSQRVTARRCKVGSRRWLRHGGNNRLIAAGREHGYHGPMLMLQWILVLLLAAVILTNLAERLAVPYPSLLAIAGAGLAFLPFAPQIRIEPELALVRPCSPSPAPDSHSCRSLRKSELSPSLHWRCSSCIPVDVNQSERDALVVRGYLSEEERDDGAAIKKAIEGVISDMAFELQ